MNQQQNLKFPSAKICIVEGHKNQYSSNICIYDKCESFNKWICTRCVLQKKHSHNLKNDNHIVDQEMFYQLLKIKQEKILKQIEVLSNCTMGFIKQLKVLAEQINVILQKLEKEIEAQNKNNTLIIIEQMIQITEEDFSQISNEQIVGFHESNIHLNIDFYQEFKQNLNRVNQNLSNIIADIDQNYCGTQLEKKNIDQEFLQKVIKSHQILTKYQPDIDSDEEIDQEEIDQEEIDQEEIDY